MLGRPTNLVLKQYSVYMAKKKKKSEERFFALHIYGIFDVKKNEIIQVSLDEEEIDVELSLISIDAEDRYKQAEFDVLVVL